MELNKTIREMQESDWGSMARIYKQSLEKGTALLTHLCEETEKFGYWTLYSAIFSVNTASIELHKKCGFRVVGYRENIAKDRFGNWQSTTIMERRN